MTQLPFWPDWSLWCAALGFLMLILLLILLIKKRFSPTMILLGLMGFVLLFFGYLDLTSSIHQLR